MTGLIAQKIYQRQYSSNDREMSTGACEVTDLTKTEGEASVYMRKGKLNFFYDWVLGGSWEGKSTILLWEGQSGVFFSPQGLCSDS